jgi:hypothetical protein
MMRSQVRRVGIIGATVLFAVIICATALGFFFLIIVTGLSGGNAQLQAEAGACFLLLVVELVLAARLTFRRKSGYQRSDGF